MSKLELFKFNPQLKGFTSIHPLILNLSNMKYSYIIFCWPNKNRLPPFDLTISKNGICLENHPYLTVSQIIEIISRKES